MCYTGQALSERLARVAIFTDEEWERLLQSLKGHLVNGGDESRARREPEHELLAAIILQALADALDGDPSAVEWMDYYAPDIACLWLGLDSAAIASWRRAARS